MAPEMVELLNPKIRTPKGYDDRVDWWSLGVTAFVMLTGSKPFRKASQYHDFFVNSEFQMAPDPNDTGFAEYDVLTKPIKYPEHLSPDSIDFLSKMLTFDESMRLTSNNAPKDALQNHPFFAGLDFGQLENKAIPPPWVPPLTRDRSPITETFVELMRGLGYEEWVRYKPAQDVQKYFQNW